MKKFIVELFSNRFGIVLAALNVCYFAGKGIVPFQPSGRIFFCANLPAAASTVFSLKFANLLMPEFFYTSRTGLGDLLFAFFIVLQWLFIARIAKTIAQRFRPVEF